MGGYTPRGSHHANIAIKQGGKNRRRGKNESDKEKRELTFKEEGQGTSFALRCILAP
jgi:translation initiation factor 1A